MLNLANDCKNKAELSGNTIKNVTFSTVDGGNKKQLLQFVLRQVQFQRRMTWNNKINQIKNLANIFHQVYMSSPHLVSISHNMQEHTFIIIW